MLVNLFQTYTKHKAFDFKVSVKFSLSENYDKTYKIL